MRSTGAGLRERTAQAALLPDRDPVWEYTTLWETFNLYFNGKLVFTNTAAMNPSTVWLHTDHLGTVRVKSNASGQAIAGTRLHYHPFGERTGAKTDPVKYEFTGKERDDDTRLDSFGARYYASTLGRFPHPDIPGIDQSAGDPQTWNLFGYVRNNPLRFVDPSGRACRQRSNGTTYDDDSGGQSCAEVNREDYERVSGALSGRVPADVEVVAQDPVAWATDEGRMRFVFDSVERLAGPTVRGLAAATIGFTGVATGAGVAGFAANLVLGSQEVSGLGIGGINTINLLSKGLDHVLNRHYPGGANTAGRSVFLAGENIANLILKAHAVAPIRQGGRLVRIVDAGRPIGVDRATGQMTSVYTVVTDKAGIVITAFPGVPGR